MKKVKKNVIPQMKVEKQERNEQCQQWDKKCVSKWIKVPLKCEMKDEMKTPWLLLQNEWFDSNLFDKRTVNEHFALFRLTTVLTFGTNVLNRIDACVRFVSTY